MSIADKILTLKADLDAVYEAGKNKGGNTQDSYDKGYTDGYDDGNRKGYAEGIEIGYNKAESVNPLYYIKDISFRFSGSIFSEERSNVVCRVLDCKEWNMAFGQLSGIKTLKIICDTPNLTVGFAQLVRQSADLELLDLSEFKCYPNTLAYFTYEANKLKTIVGALDLTKCTEAKSAFVADSLENIEFVPNTIPISMGFQYCKNLTHDSLMSIINGLMDYTYDITGNPFKEMHPDRMTNGMSSYTIEKVVDEGHGYYYIETTDDETGNDCHFYCLGEMVHSEEIINALKVGEKFIIDCSITFENGKYKVNYNSFKVSTGTAPTLTLGTTNLNKLEPEEKQIARLKGWTLP